GVVHWDLKPANILVASDDPFRIVLADFGFATDELFLDTFGGTYDYIAPEVYARGCYTSSVDLWSLGVVVLRYACGLPEAFRPILPEHSRQTVGRRGLSWCDSIVEYANDWEPDPLIDLL